jgi:hypothetical protein
MSPLEQERSSGIGRKNESGGMMVNRSAIESKQSYQGKWDYDARKYSYATPPLL